MNEEKQEKNTLCDESKCVSRGLSGLHGGAFTCYGEEYGSSFPMMCTDGYRPNIVESVSPTAHGENSFLYFTCCPPDSIENRDQVRHCSDPLIINDQANQTLCSNIFQPFPLQRQSVFDPSGLTTPIESYVCCDVPQSDTTDSFLNETECVPYHDEHFTESKKGSADVVCNFPEDGVNSFFFPHKLDKPANGTRYVHAYECCKNPGIPVKVWDWDDVPFGMKVPNILLAITGTLSCLLLIASILVPLLKNQWKQSFSEHFSESFRGSSDLQAARRNSKKNSTRSRRRSIPTDGEFNGYNVYLVYLATPDLLINLSLITFFCLDFEEDYKDYQLWRSLYSLVFTYTVTNLLLNAVVAYEVMLLLERSHRRERTSPPTFARVTGQAFAVFLYVASNVAVGFLVGIPESKDLGSVGPGTLVWFLYNVIGFLVLPFGVILWVSCKIWWKGYMSSIDTTNPERKRAVRELVWYFSRIIAVVIATWIPFWLMMFFANNEWWVILLQSSIVSLQALISFGFALTKSDVRSSVWMFLKDFVQHCCCCCCCCCCYCFQDDSSPEIEHPHKDFELPSTLVLPPTPSDVDLQSTNEHSSVFLWTRDDPSLHGDSSNSSCCCED